MRVVCEGSGWNAHAAASSPAVGVLDTSRTERWLGIRAAKDTLRARYLELYDQLADQMAK